MNYPFHEEIIRGRYADMLRDARRAELAALIRAEQEHTSLFGRGLELVARVPRLRVRRTRGTSEAYA